MKKKTYWKSLKYRDGKIVSNYDKSEWVVGQWRVNPYPVTKECEGLNCSELIVDAMGFVPCEVLVQVEIRGTTIASDDKVTAHEMRIVKAWQWTKEDSVAMAIYAAELVIEYYERGYPNDPRPRNAIEAAKAWLANPTNDAAYSAANAAYAANAAANAATYAAANAATYAAYSATYAADAAANAADAAAYAADAAAYAADNSAAYAADNSAAYAADNSAARLEMKNKFQKWIISHLKHKEGLV